MRFEGVFCRLSANRKSEVWVRAHVMERGALFRAVSASRCVVASMLGKGNSYPSRQFGVVGLLLAERRHRRREPERASIRWRIGKKQDLTPRRAPRRP